LILVTVGMHNAPFDRLVRSADEMASFIEESVVIQRGVSEYTPTFSQYVDFTDEAQMQAWLSQVRAVVSHAGAGSILSALKAGKPLVLVPRLRRFGEHVDDHQLELAEALAQRKKAVIVLEPSAGDLHEAVAQANELARTRTVSNSLQAALRAWLAEQAG
jgi:beta-1,4-N-acetylglucosaminyltransferase